MRISDNLTYHPGSPLPDPETTTPEVIREILASVLATKDARQKAAIQGIFERLQRKLPSWRLSAESFVDLYPIHPDVFNALFQLGSILPGFSALRFAQEAIPASLERPEEQLVTLDHLFDSIRPELRKVKRFGPLLDSYECFRANVLPQFKPAVQPKVEALLKAIAFSTICEGRAADVRSLANSLLLCEDSDFLPSYSLTSALLMEMEQRGGIHFVAEGKKLERSYRLLDLLRPPSLFAAHEPLEIEEEFRSRLPLLLYDWIRSEIPVWKADLGSKYERSSQSLVAPLPEGERGRTGLVYFKSVYDPFWSQEDFQVLEASQYPWILLVLSPLERFYETDAMLRELAGRSERILIWRPGRLSREEVERLQKLLSFRPSLGGVDSAAETYSEARGEARRILKSLYVERGEFLTSGDQWPIGEEIENRTLAQYLSVHLTALVSLAHDKFPEGATASLAAPVAVKTDEHDVIRLAALLAGLEGREAEDPDLVRNRFLEWWNSVLETETAALSAKARPLPDSLRTTHFWREVKLAGSHLQNLEPFLESFRRGESSLRDAIEEALRYFSGDEYRLLEWRESLQNLAGLVRWLPGFEHSRDYVLAAFPLGVEKLDEQRASLLDSIAEPHRFIQPSGRARFDKDFLDFKRGYIDYYDSAHEEALNIVSASKEAERKVDAKALQNLELLSNLLYTDKSYLNRVRILGRWILRSQCLLPVREILERYPRCYCNFNPAGNRELVESAAQINTLIQEGIEYFRGTLRKCSRMIINDLKRMKLDDFHCMQIASLLSRETLLPLKSETIEILNKVIAEHSSDFLLALRSQ